MDFSNIKGLLETNESIELSDNELEDELNAILSGQYVKPKQTKQNTSSSVENVKRIKQNDYQKRQNAAKNTNKTNTNFSFSDNLLDIEKLGLVEDQEIEEDIDEDNEDLLSELNDIIVSDKKVPKSVDKNIDYEKPQIVNEIKPNNKIQNITQEIQSTKQISVNKREEIQRFEGKNEPLVPSSSQNLMTIQNNNKSEIPRLIILRDQYKRAALNAKKSGQQTIALSHIKTAKQIEVLVKAIEDGINVDLSQIPPPPPYIPAPEGESNTKQLSSLSAPAVDTNSQELSTDFDDQNVELNSDEKKKLFNAPPPPNSVMEALEQRLDKFKSTLEQAKQEDNAGKVRRLGRIVKQYENAIKDVKKGKAVDFDELPTPPGFGAIPVDNSMKKANNSSNESSDPNKSIQTPKPSITPKPTTPLRTSDGNKPIASKPTQSSAQTQNQTNASNESKPTQRPALKRASSTANKQLNYLLERQRLFKEAALESKQKGDIQQAKEYLRMSKGFDPLIEATQNGLPINAISIPTPPQMSEDFVVVSLPESSDMDDLEKGEIYRKIEIELQKQIEMCKRNNEYFLQLGDISTASKFEKYSVESKKDLDMLIVHWRNGDKVPKFKYETRTFSIVICNTEVGINEVLLEVVKVIDIAAKPDVDTYVRIEFPFPNVSLRRNFDKILTIICGAQDNNQTARTKTIKNNTNPVFGETFKFEIDRKSRQLPRVFKRHPLKLELISKGGFLRSDTLIGTALIKLNDFETKCTIHDTYALTEGRKTVGGRIEAKIKIREPLLAKQVEEVKEKWLFFI